MGVLFIVKAISKTRAATVETVQGRGNAQMPREEMGTGNAKLPNAKCQMPNAECRMPNAAECQMTNAKLPNAAE
jgi:hypothetical protein